MNEPMNKAAMLAAIFRIDSPYKTVGTMIPKVVYDEFGIYLDTADGKLYASPDGIEKECEVTPTHVEFPDSDGNYNDVDNLPNLKPCDFSGEADDLSCYLFFDIVEEDNRPDITAVFNSMIEKLQTACHEYNRTVRGETSNCAHAKYLQGKIDVIREILSDMGIPVELGYCNIWTGADMDSGYRYIQCETNRDVFDAMISDERKFVNRIYYLLDENGVDTDLTV